MSQTGCYRDGQVICRDGSLANLGEVCGIRDNAELQVYPMVQGTTVLQWDLRKIRGIRAWASPLETAVDFSHLGITAEVVWNEIAAYEERDGQLSVPDRLLFGSELNGHFRLRIRDAGQQVYITQPVSWSDNIPRRLQRLYREGMRRWANRIDRGELRRGVLLKRSRWGSYCTACRDRDGDQQIRSQCTVCFDTGFENGYHVGDLCSAVEAQPAQLAEKFDFGAGYVQQGPVTQFLLRNVPQVYPGDVWVDSTTDERWVLGSPMRTTAQVGNVQLFRSAPASRLDFTHVIYGVTW